ncbi:hypothetical protein ABIE89_008233 [Bradyrhizobium niftali]
MAITFKAIFRQLTPAEKRKLAVDKRRLRYELGSLIQSWSLLNEQLAGLFQQATECSPHVTNSVWHSIKSDLAQREMLSAALRSRIELYEAQVLDNKQRLKVLVLQEYLWAVQEITKFSHKRNDMVHSPIVFRRKATDIEYEARIHDWHGNPRAAKLADKELYQYCRSLTDFTERMGAHLTSLWQHVHKHGTLPERPQWRSISLFPSRKQSPHRKSPKRQKRPLRPSRA